ncbi:MAG: hypothetical protein V1708_04975 [Candidatus Micrarchaeota archaeon]
MRLVAALFLAAALAANANALVIVPPTVYFLTLSLSAFLANAVVSLFIFGALRGLLGRKLWGKSVFEVASSGVSALGTAIVALFAMACAAYFIRPLDLPSAALCALAAGVIFLAFKIVLSFKEYIVSPGTRRALAISWLSLAAFVALAAGVSSVLAVEERSISTFGGYYPQYPQQGAGMAQGVANDLVQNAPAPGAAQKEQAGEMAKEKEGDAGIIVEPNQPGPSAAISRLWFQPMSQNECVVTIGSFGKSFSPSYSCAVVRNGERARALCPVWVDAAQIGESGAVAFSATGSCDDAGTVTLTGGAFTQIKR